MPAKLLFLADLHCHNHAQFAQTLPNGRNSRLQDCLNILKQAKDVSLEHRCDAVFILGDLFHSRTKIDVDVYSDTWMAVKDLAAATRVFLLKGNHDCHSKVGDVHSLEPFKTICTVIDQPTMIPEFGCSIWAFPYTDNVQELVQTITALPQCDLLLLHQAMREGAVGPYGATGHGELSINDLPLDRVRYVFAGDYHKRQWFGPGGKVHYIGSPLQLTFGEAGEFKAFTLLEIPSFATHEIATAAPRFHTFETPAEFVKAKQAGLVRLDVDFVRVLHDEQDRKAAEQVKIECPRVQVVEEAQQKQVLQRIGQEIASSDTLLLDAYINQKGTTLDAEKLVSMGLEILGEE